MTAWRTSSHSAANGNCVQVASHGVIRVRDSKNPDAGSLTMTPAQWRAFLDRVKHDHSYPPVSDPDLPQVTETGWESSIPPSAATGITTRS